jgi:hypothetical protein
VRPSGFFLIACLCGAPAAAQPVPATPLPGAPSPGTGSTVPDSVQADAAVVRPTVPFGSAVTFRDIQREYSRLRPKPRPASDSAFAESRIGIIRLVVDETISRAGAQFYDIFYQLWRPPPGAAFSTVVLSEQPLPGQGTLVSVRLDGEIVFQSRLQPREEVIEQTAEQAVQTTLRRIVGA